jgi:hypothetical protein
MQSFVGGKFFATDFLKFRLHFLPQILPLVCKVLEAVNFVGFVGFVGVQSRTKCRPWKVRAP